MTALILLLAAAAFVALKRSNDASDEVRRLSIRLEEMQDRIESLLQSGRQPPRDEPEPVEVEAAPAPRSNVWQTRNDAPVAAPEAAAPALDEQADIAEIASPFPPAEILPPVAATQPPPAPLPPAPPPPAEPEPAPAFAQPPAPRDAEQAFATRWAIWIGGVALAMGGLLIVRYSIEAGLLGPAVRIALGALFSMALAGAAEVLRRKELQIPQSPLRAEDIPSVLAGASVVSGFGVVYAAHALYGMIGTSGAFVLLGAIGLAALLASLAYGSALGLLGLAGSYVTPLLVGGTEPNAPALALFVAMVTGAAFAIDLRRRSASIVGSAVAGHAIWTLLIALAAPGSGWTAFLLIFAAAAALLDVECADRDAALAGQRARAVRFAAFVAPLGVAGLLLVHQGGDAAFRLALLALIAATVGAAVRARGLALLAPVAGAAAVGYIFLWPSSLGALHMTPGLLTDMLRLEVAPTVGPGFVACALIFAALLSPPLVFALLRPYRNGGEDFLARGALAFASALAPIALLLAVSLRLNGFERTPGFAALAALLMAALAVVSELLFRRERGGRSPQEDPLAYLGSSAHAAGATIALGLAVAFALRETWLVVGLSIASAGVALVARVRPIPLLRSLAAALGAAALGRLVWRPVVSDLGDFPLFNWLIPAYGAPAAAFAVAARALAERRDRALATAQTLFAVFLSLFVLTEIAQFFIGADLRDAPYALTWGLKIDPTSAFQRHATGFYALASIALALLSLQFGRLGARLPSAVYSGASAVLALALVGCCVFGLGVEANPLLNGAEVREPAFFNRLLFGYVGTSIVLGLLSRRAFSPDDDSLLRNVLEGVSALLAPLGALLALRHMASGTVLTEWTLTGAAFSQSVRDILLWLTSAAIVALWRRRRASLVLGWALVALCALALIEAAWRLGLTQNPFLDFSGVDGPIVFNRILWGYAPVGIGFLIVARLIDAAEDWLARALRIAGGVTLALMIFLLVRHAFHGPMLHSQWPVTLAEAGVYGLAALGAAAARTLRRRATDETTIAAANAAIGVAALALAIAIIGGAPLTGWPIFTNSTLGVLAPAVVAGAFSRWLRKRNYGLVLQRAYGGAAMIGGLFYALLQARLLFPETPDLLEGWGPGSNMTRFYAYSAAMLLFGVGALIAGLKLVHRDLRLAALGVIALVICKVFLLDLAHLEGLWRAASFIGLGGSLIGVAYLYRWLMPLGASDEA